MRLYRRGKSTAWTIDIRHRGKRYVVSSRITNQKQANEWARDFIAQLHRDEYRPQQSAVTFERLCELARTYYRVNARRSLKTLDYAIKRLNREFAGVRAV